MVMRLWILPASLVGTLLPTLSRQNAIEEVDFATVLGRNRPELGYQHDYFLSIGTGLRSLRRVFMLLIWNGFSSHVARLNTTRPIC